METVEYLELQWTDEHYTGLNGLVMYKVSSREPCRIEQGDIIYLGLAPVKVQ